LFPKTREPFPPLEEFSGFWDQLLRFITASPLMEEYDSSRKPGLDENHEEAGNPTDDHTS
jgi:hypothetical protein